MSCENCKLRSAYDRNPRSLLGRFWRWHIRFCPGWKKHVAGLSDLEREQLGQRYDLKLK